MWNLNWLDAADVRAKVQGRLGKTSLDVRASAQLLEEIDVRGGSDAFAFSYDLIKKKLGRSGLTTLRAALKLQLHLQYILRWMAKYVTRRAIVTSDESLYKFTVQSFGEAASSPSAQYALEQLAAWPS
eukprot:6118890-Prymnesium_polylepis.1